MARSASVREPSKTHTSNASPPVGGLSHQGKLDNESSEETQKPPRESKRRTVQVEYVAPSSQTARGDTTPSVQSPSTIESPSAVGTNFSKTRPRAGAETLENIPRQPSGVSTVGKPLPREPNIVQTSGSSRYQYQSGADKTQKGSSSSPQVQAPLRPPNEVPRSASDTGNAFGFPTIARPNTSGSLASNGRLPSRGNSYSQPLAPTVAATNAQGRLAQPVQPKNGGKPSISAPIPQTGPYFMEESIGRPSTQQTIQAPSLSAQRDLARGHKRSTTLGTVLARSGSLFRSQPQPPSEKLPTEKRYPPTSMRTAIASSDSPPRRSVEPRRSTSFGFGRKSSNLQKNNELPKQEKPRRFSILPFSLKSFTGGSKDQSSEYLPVSEHRPSTVAQPIPPSRGQPRPQTMGGPSSSRPDIYHRDDLGLGGYSQRERTQESMSQEARSNIAPSRTMPQMQQLARPHYPSRQTYSASARHLQGQSYLLEQSGTPTESEFSLGPSQHLPVNPAGFDSYEEEASVPSQPNRSTRVLQKNNRRFTDAYEQDQEPGYGAGGHHAGSSGAAKRVAEFFRRRGKKAWFGDDRV